MPISIPETVVTITRPPEGETVSVATEPQRVYHLTFEPANVIFDAGQNNLHIIFNAHTQVVLHNFCRVVESGSIFFELPDGAIIDALELYRNLTITNEDFETHAALLDGSACLPGIDHHPLPLPEEPSSPLSFHDVLAAPEPPLFDTVPGARDMCPLAPDPQPSAAPCGIVPATNAETEAEALMRLFSIIG